MVARSKSRWIGAGIVFTVALSVAAHNAPAPYRSVGAGIVVAVLVARWLVGAPAAWRRITGAARAGKPGPSALMHVLPDGLRKMLLVELTIYREALCAMTRRPRPSERVARSLSADARFTLHAGPISSVLMPLLLIGTFLELPLLHLAIHVKAAPAMRLSLHAALVGLTAWGLVWLFGDRSAVRHVPHVLAADELLLHVGFRVAVRLPTCEIASVRLVKGAPRDWLPTLGIKRADVAFVTPVDKPNLLIELTPLHERTTHERFGSAATVPLYFAVYVDKPESLRNDIVARILPH